MRTQFVIALMLAVVFLLPIVTGVSTAPQDEPNKANLDYKIYLPIVVKPPCTWVHPTVYVAVNNPIMRVGDYLTVTGALMNDCAIIEHPDYQLEASPEDLIQPSRIVTNAFSQFIDYGTYAPFTFTVQAISAGEVTITLASTFIEHDPSRPPWYPGWWSGEYRSIVVRILP
jgi:hypothetical protein